MTEPKAEVIIDMRTAMALESAYTDILAAHTRYGCSDAGFRRHFLTLCKSYLLVDAHAALRDAIRAADARGQPDTGK